MTWTSCTWCPQATAQIRSQPPHISFIFTPTFHSHSHSPQSTLSSLLSLFSLCGCLCFVYVRTKNNNKNKNNNKMLLGKRPRPPMKRTTSMTGITMDPSVFEPQESSDHHDDDYNQHGIAVDSEGYSLSLPPSDQNMDMNLDTMNFVPNSNGHDHRLLAMVSPRATKSTILRRNSGDFIETSHFLHTCGLCQRRLPPGRDIYMYRYKQ